VKPRTQRVLDAAAWIALYLVVATGPLLVLALGRLPPSRGFAWDFAIALGYAGMGMLGVQFVLTARFRRAASPFGIDVVYVFHRWLGVVALALVAAHYGVLRIAQPASLGPLDPGQAPAYMTAGRVALLAFVVLVATSLARRRIRLEYDAWRRLHAVLAVCGFVGALAHIAGAGRYLDDPLTGRLWLAATFAWLALVVHVRVVRPWRLLQRPYRVVEVRRERGGSVTLALAPEAGRAFAYEPGQFVWLTLRASPFAMREHPFSLSSAPTRPGPLEVTIKPLGDFTQAIRDVAPGELAYVDGPYGAFSIDRHPCAAGAVFIAGGVGIAPVMSMLRALADRGDRRRLHLVYGSARTEDTLFREEIEALRGRLALHVVHVLHDPEPTWRGETGYVDADVLRRHLPASLPDVEYFVCGPPGMIRLAGRSLAARGVDPAHVRSEIFDLA
jgi:predicted ferric reductase